MIEYPHISLVAYPLSGGFRIMVALALLRVKNVLAPYLGGAPEMCLLGVIEPR